MHRFWQNEEVIHAEMVEFQTPQFSSKKTLIHAETVEFYTLKR